MKKYWYVGSEKIFQRSYQGKDSIATTWAKESLDQAVEHAKKILAKNPAQECCFIVEIVAEVTREFPPVKVTKVE